MTLPERSRPAAPPRVDALVCRLAGALAMLAASMVLSCAVVITRLPTATGPDGLMAYALPGSRHVIDPAVVPILVSIGLVAAAAGLLAFVAGRLPLSLFEQTASAVHASRRRTSIGRHALVLLLGVAALAAVLWFKR